VIGTLNGVWWSKNITRNRKNMIYNSMVKSDLIYRAEIWSLYEDDSRRIKLSEMDALRRSARISKLDRKTNEYMRGNMDAQDMILDDIT
jgi:cell division septal protein FtsQ